MYSDWEYHAILTSTMKPLSISRTGPFVYQEANVEYDSGVSNERIREESSWQTGYQYQSDKYSRETCQFRQCQTRPFTHGRLQRSSPIRVDTPILQVALSTKTGVSADLGVLSQMAIFRKPRRKAAYRSHTFAEGAHAPFPSKVRIRQLAARFALKTAIPVYNEPLFAYLA